jgi:hypothetical protein
MTGSPDIETIEEVRAATTSTARAPKAAPPTPPAAKVAASPFQAPAGFPITVWVGTPTPVVVTFPTREMRAKSAQQLLQRIGRLPTTFVVAGKTTTFLAVTHFEFEE